MRRLLFSLFVVAGFLSVPAAVSAQEYNHIITVYAIVPEQRAVYLDASGNIVKIAGNTTKNVTPMVIDSNNKVAPMTPAVQGQYDDFLSRHKNQLLAGKIYSVNPLTISPAPNTQVIEINAAPSTLVGLKID